MIQTRKLKHSLILVFILISVSLVEFQYGIKDIVVNRMMLTEKNFLPYYVNTESILVPTNLTSVEERKFICCFVPTSPNQRLQRDVIRQTWGNLLKPSFLIGRGDKKTMSEVTKEALEFNDIIIEDFEDTYKNLTVKTAFAMKNFLKHFNGSKYFAKIDVDSFVNVELLNKFVHEAPGNKMIGVEAGTLKIVRGNRRWAVPEYLLAGKDYPPFLIGGAYLIPG